MYGILSGGNLIATFVAPMSVYSNRAEFLSDTLSLERKAAATLGQRWEIETRLDPKSDDANDIFVDLVTKGHTELVSVLVPQNIGVIRKRTSTATPTGDGAEGSSILTVSGNTGLIPKGTFIKFAATTKVYMLTSDITGNGVVGVYPPLREAISSTFTHQDDVIMQCSYDISVVSGMQFSDGILQDMGVVKLVERL